MKFDLETYNRIVYELRLVDRTDHPTAGSEKDSSAQLVKSDRTEVDPSEQERGAPNQ